MNCSILYVPQDAAAHEWPWSTDLTAHGIVLLRASNLREAEAYCRAYDLMAVVVDVGDGEDRQRDYVAQVIESASRKRPTPVIGLFSGLLSAEARSSLAIAGLKDLISRDDPEAFMLWPLLTLMNLNQLHQFEKTRMDVNELASKTRERLHDLSQPLAAVQGRLQLLAAKAPAGDPYAATFAELVQLTLNVTRQVMEIQQLHRHYS